MKVTRLQESNELQDRAKKHRKNNKGLSPFCTLNTDAGNVEYNVSMFNMMNSSSDAPSVNPCGPMAENFNTAEVSNLFKLHVGDKVEYEGKTYTVDGIQNDAEHTELVPSMLNLNGQWVPEEHVILNTDFILKEKTEMKYIDLHYDDLTVDVVTKHSRPGSYHFVYGRDEAQTKEEQISYDYSVSKVEIINLLAELVSEEDYSNLDNLTDDELKMNISRDFDTLFTKYESGILSHYRKSAKEQAERNMNEELCESMDRHIIMAINHDGSRLYYNVSSEPHWVKNGAEATLFDDLDDARSMWFKIDKNPFKRVFVPIYNADLMNESIDRDQMYLIGLLQDRIEVVMDGYVGRYYQTIPAGNDTYKVNTKHGRFIMKVQFDTHDPLAGFVFSIDGADAYHMKDDREVAKVIIEAARKKYVKSFDVAVEGLSDRIRKNDMEYDDELDAYLASEGNTTVQFQDRETHEHEFHTDKNQWGRSYVDRQYNKHPKVASSTWGRVWKDGKLDKSFEGPKYQVRAEMAKYLDEDWTPPADWVSYKGAWIYPVENGFEANFMGSHFEAATMDEMKVKLMNARAHRQRFSGYSEQDRKFADNIKQYGRELSDDHHEPTKEEILTWLEDHEQAYSDAQEFFSGTSLDAVKLEDLLSWIEDHKVLYQDFMRFFNLEESWKPDLTDCPACGDISFDSKKGRCTKCSYNEDLEESVEYVKWVQLPDGKWKMWGSNPSSEIDPNFLEIARKQNNVDYRDVKISKNGEYPEGVSEDDIYSKHKLNGNEATVMNEWNEFSDDDFEDDQMHSAVYGGDSKYCKVCGAIKAYDEDGFAFCPECNQDDLHEASYGGAFDIADDQYFMRDDLVACAEKVIDHLNETFDDTFEIVDLGMEGNVFVLEVEGKKFGTYEDSCTIDMRKIRVPSDLTNKYALDLAAKLIAKIKDCNNL